MLLRGAIEVLRGGIGGQVAEGVVWSAEGLSGGGGRGRYGER